MAFVRELVRAHADRRDVHTNPGDGSRFYHDATEIEERTVSQIDSTREHLIETYRKKAKHYDITSQFYPAPGYPQRAHRLRAIQALGLRPGDSVVDIACGTGLNFSPIEQVDRSRRPDRRRRSDRRDARPSPAPDRDQRLEQYQPRASRRGRVRFPNRGRRDPVHIRPDAGARMRRCRRPRRCGPLPRWALGGTGSQGSPRHASVASGGSGLGTCAAVRLHRRVGRAPSVGGDSRSYAGYAGRSLLDRLFFGTAFLAAGSRGSLGPAMNHRRGATPAHSVTFAARPRILQQRRDSS